MAKSDDTGDVLELNPAAGFRVDVDAAPAEEIPAFQVEFVMDGKTTTFSIPEPDGETAMDIEEAQVSRRFFMLMFGDQWPDARKFVEATKDRRNHVSLALRYLRHFELDSSAISDEDEKLNRAQRRQRRRSARR